MFTDQSQFSDRDLQYLAKFDIDTDESTPSKYKIELRPLSVSALQTKQDFVDPDNHFEKVDKLDLEDLPDTSDYDVRLMKGESSVDLDKAHNYLDFMQASIKNMVGYENQLSEDSIRSERLLSNRK